MALFALPAAGAFGKIMGSVAGSAIGTVAVGLGLTAVTYVGADAAIGQLDQEFLANYANLPPQVIQLYNLLQIKTAFLFLTSAAAAKFAMSAGSKVKLKGKS